MRKRKIATFYWLLKCVRFHAGLYTCGGIIYCGICLCFVLLAKECSKDQEGFSLPHLIKQVTKPWCSGSVLLHVPSAKVPLCNKTPKQKWLKQWTHYLISYNKSGCRRPQIIRDPGLPSFSSVMLSGCLDPWPWPLRITTWQLLCQASRHWSKEDGFPLLCLFYSWRLSRLPIHSSDHHALGLRWRHLYSGQQNRKGE